MPSYHQMELAAEFVKKLGNQNFRIIFYQSLSDSRSEMSWVDNYTQDYVIRFSASDASKKVGKDWIKSADIVIQGRFPSKYIRQRVKSGKLTFAYQERLWKKGFTIFRYLTRLPYLIKNYYSLNKPNYHFLAAGAYASADMRKIGMFNKRCWKFGYFIHPKPNLERKSRTDDVLKILWCARFSPVKQPSTVVEIARELRNMRVRFELTMIGDGELYEKTKQEITHSSLENEISLIGWQAQEKVEKFMSKADIFLMTSDHREGWGIVINEAMTNGCLVVANKEIGSVPWLLQHGTNGVVYQRNDALFVATEIAKLDRDRERLNLMANRGREHLNEVWSTQACANAFLELSARIDLPSCQADEAEAVPQKNAIERVSRPCEPDFIGQEA